MLQHTSLHHAPLIPIIGSPFFFAAKEFCGAKAAPFAYQQGKRN
jgi:hypothetical protein